MPPLPREGYVVLRGALTPDELAALRDCVSPDLKAVAYRRLLPLLRTTLMPLAAASLGAAAPLLPTKVRVSAAGERESNGADASTLHRDLIALGRGTLSPAVTVLAYLDEAAMQVVPGSHLTPQMTLAQLARMPTPTTLCLRAGDCLVMASQLLHRGVFEKCRGSRRRLVQCFECLPQPDPATLHLPAHVGRRSAAAHRAPVLRTAAAAFGLYNASTGYGAPHPALLAQGMKYLSSDGAQPRLADLGSADTEWLPINAYLYVSPPNSISDVRSGVRALAWSFYGRQYLVLALLLALASLLVAALLF